MFRRRKPSVRRKRAYRKRAYRGRRVVGKAGLGTRFITETLNAGSLNNSAPGTSGQVWAAQFDSIPQAAQYSSLYRQFCIAKFEMILLPRFTVPDPNNQLGFAGSGGWGSVRLAYAIDESPALQAPINELDVLQSNGSKVVVCNGKKIVIRCNNPRPDMAVGNVGLPGQFANVRTKSRVWLNTDSADVKGTGTAWPHYGIRTYATMNNVGPVATDVSVPIFDVYYKITFGLRDPA